jgi:hypothetical protein
MSGLICVAGGKGAAGASTVAIALALASGPERSVTLVDADPDGGALAARFGVASTPGLVSLSAAARHGFRPDLIGPHTQHIRSGVELIAGPPSAEQLSSALGGLGRPFAQALAAIDAIADVGRWQLRSPATDLVREAVATVLVIRPSLEGVAHARCQVVDLQRICRRVEVAIVGDQPYGANEVADALAVDQVTMVPCDRRGAALLGTEPVSGRWGNRSPLMRAMRALALDFESSELVAP